VLEALNRTLASADECVQTAAWPLDVDDAVECLRAAHTIGSVMTTVQAHLVAALNAHDVAGSVRASSMAVWLRDVLRIDVPAARRLIALASALERHPALNAAAGTGEVNPAQAAVIAEVVDGLPPEVGRDVLTEAEQALIGRAALFEPLSLRRLGARVLTHVAPEVAEQAEAVALARQEARAHVTRSLSLSPQGDGRVRVSGWLPVDDAAAVSAAIEPLSRPGRTDDRSATQRRADALVEVCRRILSGAPGDGTPGSGGDRPHVVVTTTFDVLKQRLGAGTLDSGDRISAEQVRRLACDSRIIPAVLNGAGEVLDLGQSRRSVNTALRRALALRDGGCAFPGCEAPPQWTDAHHIVNWSEGGSTSLGNTVLLCWFHHRSIHHHGWQVRMAADHLPEFIPPLHVDPEQRPRRNRFHRRQ